MTRKSPAPSKGSTPTARQRREAGDDPLFIPSFLDVTHADHFLNHLTGPRTQPKHSFGVMDRDRVPTLRVRPPEAPSPLTHRTDEWRNERAYVVCAAVEAGADTFYQIRQLLVVYDNEELRSGLRHALAQEWVAQTGRRYSLDTIRARRAVMEGKGATQEFDKSKVSAALETMGFNILVRSETTKAMVILDTPEKCRELVMKVQGEEAAKRVDPVYMERYRKRAERILKEFLAQPADEIPSPASETENEGDTTMATKAKKAPKAKKAKKDGVKKVGVIDTIISTLEHAGTLTKKGYTVADIAAALVKKFPDRDADGMKSTVKIQLSRLPAQGRAKIKSDRQEGTNEKIYWI